ncbi:S-layer homology domain-containing protein [Cohnella terricola]|uniref:Carbohydrate-binding protein n=1 Tax=Cohnella terricola TaxID=1289167 RepID=A0A559JKL5_9BACL|nr:S-layer homology domain-containing protein [Cohnella terricola]TVY00405.1 hypothetical protein FPZ45_10245 [Cohnella terricola]
MKRLKISFMLILALMLIVSAFPVYADTPQGGGESSGGGTSFAGGSEYVRLKNRWQNNYLYESSDGIVRYGATRADDRSSHWKLETAGSAIRLKNRATGHYIAVTPSMQRSDPLRATEVTVSTPDDQWLIEASNRSGFYVIKNARDPSSNYVIHEEDQRGYAQYSNDINVTFESPQWAVEPAEDAVPVRLVNQFKVGQYLYEDQDGFVKYGEVPATDPYSHWYLDELSNPGDGTKTVRMRNRATGHVITQGVDWEQIKALPYVPGTPAKSSWTMSAPDASVTKVVYFQNVEAAQESPPLTYVLNTQFPDDVNARSNSWAQPTWGSSLWGIEAATDAAPRRIHNFTSGDFGVDYLHEQNGSVLVGALDKGNKAIASSYLWFPEEYDGGKRLRNLATGRYIADVGIAGGPVLALDEGAGDGTDRWTIRPSEDYDDYVSVQNAVYSNHYLHMTTSPGIAQAGIVDPDSKPAQWLFEDPAFASDGEQIYVRIENVWQPFVLYEDANGQLKYGNALLNDERAQWVIERYEGRKRIKNRATGHYVNLGSAPAGRIGVSGGDATGLEARWIIQDVGNGVKLIQSLSDRTDGGGQNKYINLQNLNKFAEYAVINPGWSSPRWRFVLVKDPEPTNFRFKNKQSGQYLYEAYSGGESGQLMFGDLPASDRSSVWFKEDTGDGVGTYRLKNLASGNYVSMEHFAAGGHETEEAPDVPLQTIKTIYPVWGSVKWYVQPAPDVTYANIRSGWTGEHFVYADASGAAKVRKNAADSGDAQWLAEAVDLQAPLPTGDIRIKNVANGQYLYENGSGVVMYGALAADNGYSHWKIVSENGYEKLVNRVTGHAIRAETSSRMIESKQPGGAADPGYLWKLQATPDGANYTIRSAKEGIDDELINVQGGAGFAERGLYPSSFGSVRWTFEAAPDAFTTPPWNADRNVNTTTPIQDDTNYVRILSHAGANGGSRTLTMTNGKLQFGSANRTDESAQWLLRDFNGRKLLQNRATGGYATIGDAGDGALNAQWTVEERLGYRILRNASQASGSLIAQPLGVSYGTSPNANDSMWTFDPVISDVKYEAEDAFVGAGVRIGNAAEAAGYSGAGYAYSFVNDKGKVSFAVRAQAGGTYETAIRYRNPGEASVLNLIVNGYAAVPLELPSADKWTDAVVKVELRRGMNSLALQVATPGTSDDVAIDYVIVRGSVNKDYRGATLPYTTYEAEQAVTNGEILGPSRAYLDVASEASGRQAVRLNAAGQYVEFKTAEAANSIVLRFSMPDSAAGTGIEDDLALYVNGQLRQQLRLNSKHAWEYGSYPWSNDPNQGSGHRFFDEMHALIGDVPAGATIRLQKNEGGAADYIVIDLADLEQVDGPYARPAGFLSIEDYGAFANDGVDDSKALKDAITKAKAQGKGVWIPAGTFDFGDELIVLDDVTIRGAGMWHTTLKKAKFFGRGDNVQVYDLLVDGDLNVRDDEASTHAFEGAFGLGSVIQSVWVEHSKTGLWLTRPKNGTELTEGLYMMGLRLRNLMADGINFCVGTSDSLLEQTDIRYPGDDGIAMWSAEGMASINNTARFNTVSLPWLADNIVVFGGRDNKIQDNIVKDTIVNGAGIAVSTRFNPVPFSGTTVVERNTLIRTGSYDTGFGLNLGAIWLFADTKDLNGGVIVRDNTAIDSSHGGLFLQGPNALDNVILRNNVLDGVGTNGIEASSDAKGELVLDNLIVRGEQVALTGTLPGGLALTETGEGIAPNGPKYRATLNGGADNVLRLVSGGSGTLRFWKDSTEVTSRSAVSVEPVGIASVQANGSIRGNAVGHALLTLDEGGHKRIYTLEVVPSSGSGSSGGSGRGSTVPVPSGFAANDAKLLEAVKAAVAGGKKTVELDAGADQAGGKLPLTVAALRKIASEHPDFVLLVKNGNASYAFPADLIGRLLNDAGLADDAEAVWTFAIGAPSNEKVDKVKEQAKKQGLTLVGEPVEFSVTVSRDGKTVKEFTHFGGTYVERTIVLDRGLPAGVPAAFYYDEKTGTLVYVPAKFAARDGKTTVTILSPGNSVYAAAVATYPKSFADTKGHWAEEAIAALTAKTILNGVSKAEFAPRKPVTRAEFAAMLVRALGLRDGGAPAAFGDVKPGAWYADPVRIAAQYWIVEGSSDGTFRPGATITREQMAVMVARALALRPSAGPAKDLPALRDKDKLQSWSKEAVDAVLRAGIMEGKSSGLFAPGDSATRAEAAVLLERLLKAMDLI